MCVCVCVCVCVCLFLYVPSSITSNEPTQNGSS